MSRSTPAWTRQFWLKKPVADVQHEAARRELRRTLGRANLVNLGIGAIIGSGIFVMTGQVAAANAGPAVMLSFVIAGIACALAGLCYAELASTMPASGSAYTYAYCTLGEGFAWIMGWLLLLEYGVSASMVAVGWSGYVVSLLGDLGVRFPQLTLSGELQPVWATPLVASQEDAAGNQVLQLTSTANLLAAAGLFSIAVLLAAGIRESVRLNNVTVAIKIAVLAAFVIVGLPYLDPDNWSPFIPENTSGTLGEFGWSGVLRGAGVIFFTYVGFEAVSTAAGEARDPQRDVPFGILGSLVACTLIYVAVAAVLTGIVPFRDLGVPDPIAVAADRIDPSWAFVPFAPAPSGQLNLFSLTIKVGAVAGLTSVMLVLCYGQTRVFYAMARDGLLPDAFAEVHETRRTPWRGTLLLGLVVSVAAACLPLNVLTDLCALGTAIAFALVCYAVLRLRATHPDLHRPFRAPGGRWVPYLGIATCLLIAGFNFLPMMQSALVNDPLPLVILLGYCALGVLAYIAYGVRHSTLAAARRHDDKREPPPARLQSSVPTE